jgi:hypothetical protein
VNEKLLRVVAPAIGGSSGFVAGAVFRQEEGEWKLIRCAPVLNWWKDTTIRGIETYLKGPAKKRGWEYEWLKSSQEKNALLS